MHLYERRFIFICTVHSLVTDQTIDYEMDIQLPKYNCHQERFYWWIVNVTIKSEHEEAKVPSSESSISISVKDPCFRLYSSKSHPSRSSSLHSPQVLASQQDEQISGEEYAVQ
jgi:hypothetical protein